MLTVDTIGRIRREYFVGKKPIREISRSLKVSRKVIRKAIRAPQTEFAYVRARQVQPQLGAFVGRLEQLLDENSKRPARERLTARRLHELLRDDGYAGAYDSIQRHVRDWRRNRGKTDAVFVPLWFAPVEAYQFDWSHEVVVLGHDGDQGCARAAVPQPTVLHQGVSARDAGDGVRRARPRVPVLWRGVPARHLRQHAHGGGRGVRRSRTAVQPSIPAALFALLGRADGLHAAIGLGFGRTVAEGRVSRPDGQVENQVGNSRERLFTPRLRFAGYAELNGWLEARCLSLACESGHPEVKDRTISDVFEDERPALIPYCGPFDGFHEKTLGVQKNCLVQFDRNRYSVDARAVGRTVQLHAYADRIVIRLDGEIVAEHPRRFSRDQVVYDPWHYVPVLARKPGALRNGAPFRDWQLPGSLAQVRRRLSSHADGDRQFVGILGAVLTDGLDVVEAACAEALEAKLFSRDVVLNLLARRREPVPPANLPSIGPQLTIEPAADCARYDTLRTIGELSGTR